MSYIVDAWDSNQPNAYYDRGLDWDTNLPTVNGNITPYINLVTREYILQPNFIATLSVLIQPLADLQAVLGSLDSLFDLDTAAGSQEDAVGKWVGVSRNVPVPLTGVYFQLDSATVGLDQGVLQGPFDPVTGLVALPDDIYRLLLRAVVLNNSWDGTIPGAYAIWNALFTGTGFGILIQDLSNMHMILAMTGSAPNPLTLALFLSGDLNVKPAGVMIDYYMTPYELGVPYFGLDAENSNVAGLDVGAFGFLNNGSGF